VETGFIGAGKVGTALAVGLSRIGYQISTVYSRSLTSAERLAGLLPGCHTCQEAQQLADAADMVFITTPDDTIPHIARQIQWHQGQYVLHCSGVLSLEVLKTARQDGAETGSLHPLQSFASIDQAVNNLPGSYFALEGEGSLLSLLEEIVALLKGRAIVLKAGDKALYHAAAVLTSNYTVTLLGMAAIIWESFGVPQAEAVTALLPLLRGTVNNIESIGLPGCLTGPVARGDLDTIRKHLKDIAARCPSLLSAYKEMGKQTIPIAVARGSIDKEKAGMLKDILDSKKSIPVDTKTRNQ
jgi:predicted short-subunit dehydrogenase-like oxidoreductase (DUF2520 family)